MQERLQLYQSFCRECPDFFQNGAVEPRGNLIGLQHEVLSVSDFRDPSMVLVLSRIIEDVCTVRAPDLLKQKTEGTMVAGNDLVFRHRMTGQLYPVTNSRHVDCRIICGNVIEVRSVSSVTRLTQQLHLAHVRHDGFEGK